MAVEAVHRALAREARDAPNVGARGFTRIEDAVTQLEAAAFGFGKAGSKPGQMYDFDQVSQRTPDPGDLNSTTPN